LISENQRQESAKISGEFIGSRRLALKKSLISADYFKSAGISESDRRKSAGKKDQREEEKLMHIGGE